MFKHKDDIVFFGGFNSADRLINQLSEYNFLNSEKICYYFSKKTTNQHYIKTNDNFFDLLEKIDAKIKNLYKNNL